MVCLGCSLLVMEGEVGFVEHPLIVMYIEVVCFGRPLLVMDGEVMFFGAIHEKCLCG